MRRRVGSSRRVGVCAARKRASAGQDQRALLGACGPRVRLATAASNTWYQWNSASSASSAWPSAATSSARVAAAARKPVGDVAGVVDLALHLPALVEVGEVAVAARRADAPRAR